MNCRTNRFIADVRVRESVNGCRRCGMPRNMSGCGCNRCGNNRCNRCGCGCNHNRPWGRTAVVEGEFRVFEPECGEETVFEEANACNE